MRIIGQSAGRGNKSRITIPKATGWARGTGASPEIQTESIRQKDLAATIPTLIILTLLSLRPAFAQYALDWHTIDGGGGASTGGVYSVSGMMGQPDAGGTMTNGPYSVTGGFWALPTAIQAGGAPMLTILPAASRQATISWTPSMPDFVLQETWSLSANWTNSPSGATNPVVVPTTFPMKFYRLSKP